MFFLYFYFCKGTDIKEGTTKSDDANVDNVILPYEAPDTTGKDTQKCIANLTFCVKQKKKLLSFICMSNLQKQMWKSR